MQVAQTIFPSLTYAIFLCCVRGNPFCSGGSLPLPPSPPAEFQKPFVSPPPLPFLCTCSIPTFPSVLSPSPPPPPPPQSLIALYPLPSPAENHFSNCQLGGRRASATASPPQKKPPLHEFPHFLLPFFFISFFLIFFSPVRLGKKEEGQCMMNCRLFSRRRGDTGKREEEEEMAACGVGPGPTRTGLLGKKIPPVPFLASPSLWIYRGKLRSS